MYAHTLLTALWRERSRYTLLWILA